MIYILVGGPRSGKTRFLNDLGIKRMNDVHDVAYELENTSVYVENMAFDDYVSNRKTDEFILQSITHNLVDITPHGWFCTDRYNLFVCVNELSELGPSLRDVIENNNGSKVKVIYF